MRTCARHMGLRDAQAHKSDLFGWWGRSAVATVAGEAAKGPRAAAVAGRGSVFRY